MAEGEIFKFEQLSYDAQCYYFTYVLLRHFEGKSVKEISNEIPFLSKESIAGAIYGLKVFKPRIYKEIKEAYERNPSAIETLKKTEPEEFCDKLKQIYKEQETWYKRFFNKIIKGIKKCLSL